MKVLFNQIYIVLRSQMYKWNCWFSAHFS